MPSQAYFRIILQPPGKLMKATVPIPGYWLDFSRLIKCVRFQKWWKCILILHISRCWIAGFSYKKNFLAILLCNFICLKMVCRVDNSPLYSYIMQNVLLNSKTFALFSKNDHDNSPDKNLTKPPHLSSLRKNGHFPVIELRDLYFHATDRSDAHSPVCPPVAPSIYEFIAPINDGRGLWQPFRRMRQQESHFFSVCFFTRRNLFPNFARGFII